MNTSLSVATWLKRAQQKLELASIGTARLDALVLLGDELNKNSAQLLARPGLLLTDTQQSTLDRQLARRARHEPLAYIRGHTEFYGREFIITKNVLEPRPESETMIDILKSLPDSQGLHPNTHVVKTTSATNTMEVSEIQQSARRTMRIADIGTGSGALGITATLETGLTVDLFDIDSKALMVAKQNVIKFATQNRLIHSDLLAKATTPYDTLLCNLPYVPDNFYINSAAMNEPKIAIFGGPDGLDVYRRLFAQLNNFSKLPKYVLTESLPPQHAKLTQLAKGAGFKLMQTDDFIQVFTPSA